MLQKQYKTRTTTVSSFFEGNITHGDAGTANNTAAVRWGGLRWTPVRYEDLVRAATRYCGFLWTLSRFNTFTRAAKSWRWEVKYYTCTSRNALILTNEITGVLKSWVSRPTNKIVHLNPICPFWGSFSSLPPHPCLMLTPFQVFPPLLTSMVWENQLPPPNIHFPSRDVGEKVRYFFLSIDEEFIFIKDS